MRFAALAFAALTAAPALAQNAPARVEFLPIPAAMPLYLFAPNPLSGTMLKPLSEPTPNAAPDVEPVPGPPPASAAADPAPEAPSQALAEVEPDAAPVPAPEPAPPPEPAAIAPPAPTTGTVTVIVENVESASGTVNVALCDKDLSKEGCPYHKQVTPERGFVETEFDDIPPGNYAVVGYHDVNGNHEFDKLFGMPREPYALSGNGANKLIPTFRDSALAINAGQNSVVIRLKHLGG